MFISLHWLSRNDEDEYDTFNIIDTCFNLIATTPFSSPSLKHDKHKFSNTLTTYALIKAYENQHLNVPLNLAAYYNWLDINFQYDVSLKFREKQFNLMDKVLETKMKRYYFNSTNRYLIEKFGI